MDNSNDIFLWIEKKMNVVVPPYMKHILKCCGYDNCHTIATIEDADVEYFTNEVRKGNLKKFYHGKIDEEALMKGCATSPENFVFSRGHVKLLQAVVKNVKESLEIHGAGSFSLNLAKVSQKTTLKEHEKEHITSNTVSVYKKRFKFSAAPSTLTQGSNDREASSDEATSGVRKARSTIISKAIMILISHTPSLFANNFEQMVTNQLLMQIEIENDVAYIKCPYCLKSSSVSLSYSKESKNPWWNTSNFDRHVQKNHKDLADTLQSKSRRQVANDCSSESEALSLNENRDFNDNQLGIMLQNFVNSAQQNSGRKKAGYRFEELTKMFVSYIFMLSGSLAYETLNANLPHSIPSISTVRRYIADKSPRVIEGEMRTDELLQYLKKRNLPLKVSLSEDATRITGKVSYDPATNQLSGYALPLDKNGMPIKFSFPARSASEIHQHYLNPANAVSSTAYVQLAQPMDENSAPFCLMIFLIDNTFTADNVLKRWRFQASKLKEKGITIDNMSTDGDARALLAMKVLSKIGQSDLSYFDCEWFSCGGYVETTFIQDIIHILTKLRNRLLTCSRMYPIGCKIVSLSHLKYLIENVSKDKHLLTYTDIEPKDRQNYLSAEKLCSANTIKCLIDYVPGSEATVLYLKAMRGVQLSFLDHNLPTTERIYNMWSAVFLFRAWRSWLLNSERLNPNDKKSKKMYTLKDNFISSNCHTCIELNAHALVKKILVEDSVASGSDIENNAVFFPNLYGSQPCENMFRQVRSFTSTFSTVVNFNILEILNRINKIQLQNDIINHSNSAIKFPRFEKKVSAKASTAKIFQKLNRATIKCEIERARKDVIGDLEKLGIDVSKLDFHCQVKPVFEQDIPTYDSDLDDSDCEEADLLFWGNEDDERDDEFEYQHGEFPQGDYVSGITGELMLKDYRERCLETESEDGFFIDEKSPFVVVEDGKGNKKVVRKSSLCWLLSKDKHKLSSDRLVRVTEKDYSRESAENHEISSGDRYVVQNKITIGEWGIFSENAGATLNVLIGMVLGFTYLDGRTFKEREFSKVSATVHSDTVSNSRDVGVLCSFFTYSADGKLSAKFGDKHSFVNIKSYIGTIKPPEYVNKLLTISETLVKEIDRFKTNHKKPERNFDSASGLLQTERRT